MRVPMINRGPLVRSNCDTVQKNIPNLRGEFDPEEDRSSENSQSTGRMNFVLTKPLVIFEVIFGALYDVFSAVFDVFRTNFWRFLGYI